MEETNVDQAETSSVSPPPPTAEQIFGLRSLKNLLTNLRRMVPFYVYIPLYGKMYYTNRKLMDSIFSYLRVFRYPLDDLKAGTDELFSLCAEFMEINSKSHEEICERMNAMKEMVAQFQGKEGFNDLPQDLRNEIYRRVLFEVALEKIVASIDNLVSRLPIEIEELSGLLKDIELLLSQQLGQVILEGDALLIRRGLQANELFSWYLMPTWKKILSSLKQFHHWSSGNCYKSVNSIADGLSKLGPTVDTIFRLTLPADISVIYVQEKLTGRQELTNQRNLQLMQELDYSGVFETPADRT